MLQPLPSERSKALLPRAACRLALLACGAWLALGAGLAAADEGDPPAIAARLSYAEGSVSMQPAGVDQWAAAVVNRPFTTGDRLWTDQRSRAELQLGALAVRLDETTGFSFLNLDNSTVQMQVTAGTVEVHVPELTENESIEIDTPALALSVLRPGEYRVNVSDTGDVSTVEVIDGDAEVSGGGQTYPLHAQQQGTFTDSGGLAADIATLGTPDDFDTWCFGRNRSEAEARQAIGRYVSPDVTGYEDLDRYGDWRSVPEYGYVWVPTAVPVGWAPYRIGHWVWVEPWGWTWVDSQPWGFAPFHYGRWAYLRGSWCWVPGPRHVRPVYAPALVAWVGGGPGVTVSLAAGAGVAWFPLGPRDVYVPPYHVSSTYIRNVNVTNTTVINNTYITNVVRNDIVNVRSVNQSVPGAVTAVPRTVFTSAQPVAPHAIRLSPQQLRTVRVSATPPPIAPVRQSVLGLGAASGRGTHAPPSRLVDRPVVAMRIPPPAPVSFDKARQAIVANGGRPLPPPQLARLRPNTGPQPFRNARQPPPGRSAPVHAGEGSGPGRAGTVPVPGRPTEPMAPNGGVRGFREPAAPGRPERLPHGNRGSFAPGSRTDRPPNAERSPGFDQRPNAERRPSLEQRPETEQRPPAGFRSPAPGQPFRPETPERQFHPAAPGQQFRPEAPRQPLERPPTERPPAERSPVERPRVERLPPRSAPVPHVPPPQPHAGPPPQPHAGPPPHAPPPPRGAPERRGGNREHTQER